MQLGFLTDADKREEFRFCDGRQLDAEAPVEFRKMNGVELLEQANHILLLVAGSPAPGLHEIHHRRLRKKAQERLGVSKTTGHPDELNVSVPEAGGVLNADAHVDVEYPGSFK